jgi:hypothetical protein
MDSPGSVVVEGPQIPAQEMNQEETQREKDSRNNSGRQSSGESKSLYNCIAEQCAQGPKEREMINRMGRRSKKLEESVKEKDRLKRGRKLWPGDKRIGRYQ